MMKKNISIGELIDHISRLQNDVNTLMIAFSYLAFSLSREQMLPTLASIHFESLNVKWSPEQQKSFKFLASLLEEQYGGNIAMHRSAKGTIILLPTLKIFLL
ncbi:hypothetical protein KE977_004179 [Escherichia coli]|nr:hypothetical protein [Escherichia coli]EID9313582.1 hypothetical protein [Escherichia coli]ELK9429899.1 hypothetical protein [Escherichia coli]EMA0937296.1 hypothetical protein [Escherichia coli]HAX2094052.1 hypothetical protein [Escherichia coli]